MLLGELIFSTADAVYTPQVNRVSDRAIFTVDVTQIAGTTPSLQILVEHKAAVDSTWSTATGGTFTAITAKGQYALLVGGLKEQIRINCVMSGTNAWARAFFFPVSWQ
jgi:hypothetical protein